MRTFSPKTEKRLFTALAAIVFVYIAIRTVTVPLANDEAATFFNFIHTSNFLPFVNDYWTANNHYLNSALSWVCYKIFGVNEWALRLPNLFALGLFLYFVFKIGLRLKHNWLRWLFWIPLLSSHYLMEFFGYSRGYGLSIAFLMGSVHFLLLSQEVESHRYKNLLLSLLMISLGIFSNLNLLVSYLIWLALAQLPQLKNFNWKKWLSFNLLAISPGAVAIVISFILKNKEELYIGQNSLIKTIHTLTVRFADVFNDPGLYTFVGFLSTMLIVALLQNLRKLKEALTLSPSLVFFTLLGLNLLAALLMHWLLGILFPLERTAMHWMPLMVGFVVFTLDSLKGVLKTILIPMTVIILFIPVIQSIRMVNFHVSSDPFWALEQVPPEFYFAVKDNSPESEFPPSVSSSTSLNTYTWAFNNLKYDGGLGSCVNFNFWKPQYVADYLILNQKEFTTFTALYDTLVYDRYSDMTLLERKSKLAKHPLGNSNLSNWGPSKNMWNVLGEWDGLDSLVGQPIRLDYTLNLQSPHHPLRSLITLEMKDSAQNTTYYNQFNLDLLKTDFDNSTPIRSSLVLDSVPSGTHSIRTFFWNIDSKSFTLNSSAVNFYLLKEE